MAQTRPRLEQIVFKSAKTGSHSIDTYLENAEIGNRTLAQLMGDLFDANGNFAPEEILPEFQIDQTGGQTKLQYRTDATNPWEDLIGFFNDRGNFATGTAYNALDLVTVTEGSAINLYIVKSDLSAFTSQADFTASTSTQLITTNTAGILQDVQDARDDVLQDAGFIAVSTDLQATPSNIETVGNNLGANQAVTVVADDLNLGASSKITQTANNIANVNTVGGAIAAVNAVSGQLGAGLDVTVVADDLDLGANSKITQTADNITEVTAVGGDLAGSNTIGTVAADLALGASSKVAAVSSGIANVNAVGTDLLASTSNIDVCATNIDDINTVADNISDVQNFDAFGDALVANIIFGS
jgi:hypothetical protein